MDPKKKAIIDAVASLRIAMSSDEEFRKVMDGDGDSELWVLDLFNASITDDTSVLISPDGHHEAQEFSRSEIVAMATKLLLMATKI